VSETCRTSYRNKQIEKHRVLLVVLCKPVRNLWPKHSICYRSFVTYCSLHPP